ncbi:ribosomal protein L7/L12 [Streptomyces sp. NPDC101118]|uniref:ribosomal protein L7/L12 n=1 Tax=Streptomyces sp. NPDC101118 TaxID=3366109 RepID=UPI00382A8371
MLMTVSLTVAALVFAGGVITASVNARVQEVARRADRLDRKLDLIMAHLGISEPEPAGLDRVRALLRDGKKIEAIKVYRELTGEGLKEAKDAVEKLSH